MPTAPRARAPHADAADAIVNAQSVVSVVSAATVPSALRMANARLIALATRLRKPTPTAMTADRVKAVKADAAVAAVAVAMTVARVWTKPVTRFLRPKARTKPMDRRPLREHAKAPITVTAMAAAHATAMAASVARAVAAMPVRKAKKSKPQATSRHANRSV